MAARPASSAAAHSTLTDFGGYARQIKPGHRSALAPPAQEGLALGPVSLCLGPIDDLFGLEFHRTQTLGHQAGLTGDPVPADLGQMRRPGCLDAFGQRTEDRGRPAQLDRFAGMEQQAEDPLHLLGGHLAGQSQLGEGGATGPASGGFAPGYVGQVVVVSATGHGVDEVAPPTPGEDLPDREHSWLYPDLQRADRQKTFRKTSWPAGANRRDADLLHHQEMQRCAGSGL